ncbi:MAG: devB [Mycobacterium sp.]|nr:devB [Mycobacterium sp.]
MSAPAEVIVHRDAALLAKAVAARLITKLIDAQAAQGSASLVLTGGGIGAASLRAVRESPALEAVDWSQLDVWWGDERFVDRASDERNEKAAREALLDHVNVDPHRVFPMGWAGGEDGDDTVAAAERYARTLASRAPKGELVPRFDVLLLGLGPEGHIASIFPESAAAIDERMVVAVHDCPKPPPTRISLTQKAISAADEVWVVAAGGEKAEAAKRALSGSAPLDVPAAGAKGRSRTLWLLDRTAASELPSERIRPTRS